MNKNERFVITINREVGSGGRTVGRKLAEKLEVKYWDKAVIDGLTQKFGLSPERIEEIKAQKKSWWNDINNYYQNFTRSAGLGSATCRGQSVRWHPGRRGRCQVPSRAS